MSLQELSLEKEMVVLKKILFYSGKVGILCYMILLYQIARLCQYGGIRSHLPLLVVSGLGLVLSVIGWIINKKQKEETEQGISKRVFYIEIAVVLFTTLLFGGRIIYSAIPYNGALSWKLEEWRNKKEITLINTNFYETGVEGILEDLKEKIDLPEELYITERFQLTFDKEGEIQTIYTHMYGVDENGETNTYLVDYDVSSSDKMSVWLGGQANKTFEDEKRLAPMIQILEGADCREQVTEWATFGNYDTFEILYFGKREFYSPEGLVSIPGDADGTEKSDSIACLSQGGAILGYEVSLHVPDKDDTIIPVRYIIEPEYITAEEISKEQESIQVEESKEKDGWTVDNRDGSMYFFLNGTMGWRMIVTDAAAGSRYYELEKTVDGGTTWRNINSNPFAGNIGVTEGLLFFGENFGIAGLTGASKSASKLYITRDGGVTFLPLELPMELVTELPQLAKDCGFTVADYDYLEMPEKTEEGLLIKVLTEGGENEGILFQSIDNGESWRFVGITE